MISNTKSQFVQLRRSESFADKVEKGLQKVLEPIYGDQRHFIKKLFDRDDRKGEVLLENDTPVGVLVYKRDLQYKFNDIRDFFEVLAIVIINPEDSSKDYEIRLLDHAIDIAKDMHAKTVLLSVPKQSDSRSFEEKGFKIFDSRTSEKYLTLHLSRKEDSRRSERDSDTVNSKRRHNDDKERSPDRLEKKVRNGETDYHRSERHQSDYKSSHRKDYDSQRDDYGRNESSRRRDDYERREKKDFHREEKEGKVHGLTLRKKYIHQIKSGQKTVEGRIDTGAVAKYREGDKVRFFYFQDPHDDVVCKVTKIERFDTFESMLKSCGVSKCLADVTDLETGIQVYNEIPGYAEKAKKFGVLGIHLKLV